MIVPIMINWLLQVLSIIKHLIFTHTFLLQCVNIISILQLFLRSLLYALKAGVKIDYIRYD